jgi:hypothetical protein
LHKTQTAQHVAPTFGAVLQRAQDGVYLNQGSTMELIEKNMSTLFAQLGEASDEAGIAHFIALHGSLSGGTHLHEAAFWSASQASFLREALVLDAAWAPVVDELNAKLHRSPGAAGS